MNAAELARRMAEDALRIAQHLLPKGKKQGREWKAGSVQGDVGQSLSVCVSGAKAGIWSDFSTEASGDLLDLWAQCRMLSIAQAMAEAKAYLGIRQAAMPRPKPVYQRPNRPPCHTPKSRVRDWLLSRGLSEETIGAFRIGEQQHNGKVYAIFPYLRDGELINAKYRNPDDKRDMRQESGAEPCLFGWHLIEPRARTIAICEGEIDAMTLHQVGIPALSVNAGAGSHQWIDNDWDRLERFSDIFLCYDNDDAGQKGVREVANRLGLERCRVVTFSEAKDANEYLTEHQAGGSDFEHCMRSAAAFDPDELRALADYWALVKASFWPGGSEEHFPVLTLNGVDQDWFEFRPGELTVWTGINGHGKSMMLNQTQIGLMQQGQKFCVFSGEMTPKEKGRRMAKQLTGLDRPSAAYLDEAGRWIADKAWLFDLTDSAGVDRLLEVFRYAYKRYGVQHFVIDSLMMTDVPEDGPGSISAQKQAMAKFSRFCKQYGAHLHLVAHPRKGENERRAPGKLDVSGSGHLTNAADNVFSVWSARKEEEEDQDKPDACLELHKQRNGDVQARKLWLYFNREAKQFTTDPRRRAHQYIQFSTQGGYA